VKPARIWISLALLLTLIAAVSGACDETSSIPGVPADDGGPITTGVCEPDTAAKCVGPDHCPGGALCGPDGTWGPCACDGDAGEIPDARSPSDAGAHDAREGGKDAANDATGEASGDGTSDARGDESSDARPE
jgi:hypothetical protein